LCFHVPGETLILPLRIYFFLVKFLFILVKRASGYPQTPQHPGLQFCGCKIACIILIIRLTRRGTQQTWRFCRLYLSCKNPYSYRMVDKKSGWSPNFQTSYLSDIVLVEGVGRECVPSTAASRRPAVRPGKYRALVGWKLIWKTDIKLS
jgi:hypothetical protein